jgi:hypothetical protein
MRLTLDRGEQSAEMFLLVEEGNDDRNLWDAHDGTG